MIALAPFLAPLVIEPPAPIKRGRPLIGERAMTGTESKKRHRRTKFSIRLQDVAVLDFETDPFNNLEPDKPVRPFAACLYSDQFPTVIIWEENFERFKHKVIAAITALPRRFTIYAHNGGKFDFMFLVSELRGPVKFKGRGIMVATIGNHELRDSFHIIPEKLANYKKDDFDYSLLTKANRAKNRATIIQYMTNDCVYLFDIVKKFLGDYGFKISIGQAATAKLREHYKIDRFGDVTDNYLRQWFFGGRVECLVGRGHFRSHPFPNGYKLYDVNSMYPFAMAEYQHPVSSEFTNQTRGITDATIFIRLRCNNAGALVRRGDNNETSANFPSGEFYTTIWEYNVAQRYGLISNVEIVNCIDFVRRSDFRKFVDPLYAQRQECKARLPTLQKGTREYDDTKKDDIFLKLILNNAYGKQAQNPRRFKDHYVTERDGEPPVDKRGSWGDLPKFRNGAYAIWERAAPGFRFNNVATAASITGAARAILLEAIQNAGDPIYCDTDSLICRELKNTHIDKTKLGAWDIEKELDEVLIAGKKTYAYKVRGLPEGHKDRIIVRSKGASDRSWNDVLQMISGETIDAIAKGPTLTRTGGQQYMRRRLIATAPVLAPVTYHERVKAWAAR